MPVELTAELATGHGGDLGLATAMIQASAEAGAHTVKLQHYTLEALRASDPQADWLRQSRWRPDDLRSLHEVAAAAGVGFLVTPFDPAALVGLRALGLTRFKIASSAARAPWWAPCPDESVVVSYPWGLSPTIHPQVTCVTAIPLYPTPLECVGRATLLDGWSDHTVGLTASLRALVRGVRYLEVHVTIPGARVTPWDKTMADVRTLRALVEDCETIASGVSQTFRERWKT